jgi:hypothetical protein
MWPYIWVTPPIFFYTFHLEYDTYKGLLLSKISEARIKLDKNASRLFFFIKFSKNLVRMFLRGATDEIFNGLEGDIISCEEEVGKLAYSSWVS